MGLAVDTVPAFQNLNGSIRLGSSVTHADSSDLSSVDQQYFLNYSRPLLPYVTMRLSLRYSDYKTVPDNAENFWHGELLPSGELTWKSIFFASGVHYRYRQTRDLIESNNLTTRSAGGFLRSQFVNLPTVTVRYEWQDNSYELLLQPQKTTDRRFQTDARYTVRNLGLLYSFLHREFDNHSNNISQNYQQHVFRTDYSGAVLQDRLRFSGSYLFNFNRYEQNTGLTPEPYTQLTTVLGLYAEDNTPEFGALESVPALIDQVVTDPTSPEINIGGASINQNIGFDLGIPRDVSLIYIFTDRFSDPELRWDIYRSDDNQEWSILPEQVLSTFNVSQNRYEIAFSAVSGRYFKALNTTISQQPEVFVTEIQALTASETVQTGPQETQNHRLNVNTSFEASKKLSFGLDMLAGRIPETETREGRRDFNIAGSVTYRPVNMVSSVARIQQENIDYDNSAIGSRSTQTLSLSLSIDPIETMDFSVAGSRINSLENNDLYQRLTSGLFRLSTQWLPTLSTLGEVGYTHDERIQDGAVIDSWRYRLSSDARLWQNFAVIASYYFQNYTSDLPYQIESRDGADVQFTYSVTSSLFARGGVRLDREGDRKDMTQDYSLSWNLTERITASSSLRKTNSNTGNDIVTLGAQGNYSLSNRTSISLNYSYNRVSEPDISSTSSYRVGFSTSF